MSERGASWFDRRVRRRRISALGLLLIVLALLPACAADDGPPPAPVGSPAGASGGASAGAASGALGPGVPVVLLHGYTGTPAAMEPLAAVLRSAGRPVVVVPLPQRATADVAVLAAAANRGVADLQRPAVDVVGYSLGGIVARRMLLDLPPGVTVRHLVMLATPNGGVRLGDASGRPEQEHCTPANACGQIAPGSAFLAGLSREPAAAGRAGWLTIASTSDRLVTPVGAVALPGARNVVLQDVCPGLVVEHGPVVLSEPVLGLTRLFLDGRLPASPSCGEMTAAGRA